MGDDWEKAKGILNDALGVVLERRRSVSTRLEQESQIEIAENVRQQRRFSILPTGSCTSARASAATSTPLEEQRRLFQPYRSVYSKSSQSKGKGKGKGKFRGKSKVPMWTKEVVCLHDCKQMVAPSLEERMMLAKANLGLKKLTFEGDGDSYHVHTIIMEAFPVLNECGGYSLLRTSDKTRDLLLIDGPEGGIDVYFLRDILRQAKLYVRPLQCNIILEKLLDNNKENPVDEPEDYCRKCSMYFTLTELRKHVLNGMCMSSRCEKVIEIGQDSFPSNESNTATCNLANSDSDHSDWENEVVIQKIVEQSFVRNIDIATILQEHRKKVLYDEIFENDETFRVTVRRSHVFDDAVKAFKRPFDQKSHLQITFIGESSVDQGGPLREFFSLFMVALRDNGSLFSGNPFNRVLCHNIHALNNRLFETVGTIISLSIIHGGSNPSFFAPSVANYLIYECLEADINDIPDISIQKRLQKLLEADTDESFQDILSSSEYDFLAECGLFTSFTPLAEKADLVRAASIHYVLLSTLAELEQLRKGIIQTLDFKNLISSHPSLIKDLFIHKEEGVTAKYIQDLYSVKYSPSGSSTRIIQEAIIMNWISFLHDVEDHPTDDINLSKIFTFLTGMSNPPAVGFSSLDSFEIKFTNEERLPDISTCGLQITFSLSLPQNYAEFKEVMDRCIIESPGFGQA